MRGLDLSSLMLELASLMIANRILKRARKISPNCKSSAKSGHYLKSKNRMGISLRFQTSRELFRHLTKSSEVNLKHRATEEEHWAIL